MHKTTYTESLLTAMPQIARRILAAGIYNEREYGREELSALAAATEAKKEHLSFEVKRCDGRVSATIYVKIDCVWSARDDKRDGDGNEWVEYRAGFDVTWPSHGTTTLAQAAARVELYGEMVRLATRLEAEFGGRPLMHLQRTAAQIVEDETKAAQARAQRAVEALAKDGMLANLRVGGISGARHANGIPAGDYQISNGCKRFSVRVSACDNDNLLATASRLEDAAE